ncbi:hypothetical protein RRG08_036708 [Elysia crispata]|uniref:Uncharacterized protein n=1 Tax=Elysia crispata TaxID=231223 RepID=A0AAE0XUP8_9GAST|nr:hypothetical protein RRG08_036708 [Elysia crispata]
MEHEWSRLLTVRAAFRVVAQFAVSFADDSRTFRSVFFSNGCPSFTLITSSRGKVFTVTTSRAVSYFLLLSGEPVARMLPSCSCCSILLSILPFSAAHWDTRGSTVSTIRGKQSYDIIEAAKKLGLMGKEYQWILTRSCIPIGEYAPKSFPIGLLGVSFSYNMEAMKTFVRQGMLVWLHALANLEKKPALIANKTIPPEFTCDTAQASYWQDGEIIYRELLNTTVTDEEEEISFNQNGTLTRTELYIMNLQWHDRAQMRAKWVQVGRWKRNGLTMNDITWPGESAMPPIGRPKRGFLRVATLNEKPYVIYRYPEKDNSCGEKGLPCWIYPTRDKDSKVPLTNVTEKRCCVGLTMDLLKIFSQELNFDFHIKEVEDGKWGGLSKDGKRWNGLVNALLSDEADIVMTSIKINPERSTAIRFSVPYLETGIKIIVALRAGAISPTAFLEPYDYASWALILIFSVHATGTAILIFEWLSPDGLNRGLTPMREHRFSLFRSFWLIWAMLFSTSVQTDQPKGIASRFLANIWALFALVFLASYTANLAAFMITKEEYYNLSGIKDYRLQKPRSMNPPFKYATIPNGSTEANIRANHKDMYRYMQEYNQPDVDEGIEALKAQKIQAFIYDSSVLEYYASRDPKCRLVTVGNRYAMTGYGVAFPPDYQNPWIRKINKVILKLQSNGELDRLQKFWLAGACDMKKEKGVSNRTLGILNFTSAFILLGSGVLLGLIILIFEHSYFIFGRNHLRKIDKCGCCALVSLSMGKSLQLKECVDEAISKYTKNRCKDPVCETQIWKLRHQLDMALLKIENLSNIMSGNRRGQLQIKSSASQDSYDEAREIQDTRPNGTRKMLACGHAVDVNHIGWKGDVRGSKGGYEGTRTGGAPRLKAICVAPAPPPRSIPESPPLPPPPPPQRQSSSLGKHMQETTFDARPGVPVASPPDVTFRRNGNMVDKFERFLERFDREEDSVSPAPEEFDSFLPPPPFGESPLISKDTSKDSMSGDTGFGLRSSRDDGTTYIGFEDLSSDGRDSNSGYGGVPNVGLSGNPTSSNASPMHTLRRTPSYTSAVGGSLDRELPEQSSPQPTPSRIRQYGGKKYVGVQNDTALS